MSSGTSSFRGRVYAFVRNVPRGRVATYGGISLTLCGSTRLARAVGNALHCNPTLGRVPCHRVIRSDGSLGGYVSGVRAKRELLLDEGIVIRKGRVDLRIFGY